MFIVNYYCSVMNRLKKTSHILPVFVNVTTQTKGKKISINDVMSLDSESKIE